MIQTRKLALLTLALLLALAPAALAATVTAAPAAGATQSPEALLQLAPNQLARFNGKDGNPAYVAVDGVVYDVTNYPTWNAGEHKGLEAGKDLTAEFAESPHKEDLLARMPQVGRLLVFLTLEELKEFDGKGDKPAYVAVDGVIYDVSEAKVYFSGEHGGMPAGTDITEAIKAATHGENPLAKRPVVGRIQLELTLEQLREFDGKGGKPAYVAVDGVIYDVTNSRPWSGGMHNSFPAGRDLTREIKEISPHGVANLMRVPAIGVIIP